MLNMARVCTVYTLGSFIPFYGHWKSSYHIARQESGERGWSSSRWMWTSISFGYCVLCLRERLKRIYVISQRHLTTFTQKNALKLLSPHDKKERQNLNVNFRKVFTFASFHIFFSSIDSENKRFFFSNKASFFERA